MSDLTQARLKELLHYDPETGAFTWISSNRPGWLGREAGSKVYPATSNCVYIAIPLDGKTYRAQNLAWMYMKGSFPEDIIDHEDMDGTNNRWVNLRAATRSQNAMNRKVYANSQSGVKGVTWHARNKRWTAQINLEGKRHYLGSFKNLEDAARAIRLKRIELHGEFANHG